MPLHGLQHHSRSHSNIHTPETPGAGSTLIQAAQALTGIGQPSAASTISQQQQQQQHLQQPSGGGGGGLRVQTSQNNLAANSGPGSGVTSIYSGSTASGGALSGTSAAGLGFSNREPPSSSLDQQKKPTNLSFQLPSPTQGGNPGDLYTSPQDLHYPPRPSDPIQAQQLSSSTPSSQHQPQQQQYQAYHSPQPPSSTSSRPQPHTTATALGSVPRINDPLQQQQSTMHRTSTTNASLSHSSKYSPQLNTSSSSTSNRDNSVVSAGGDPGRKYTHPGALTPTYPSSTQHSSSHSHSAAAHLGMGLSGFTSPAASTREREETSAVGAVGNGKWMSPWSLYALDWCKWQPTNGGYGRVAIGSYAEDSHNYIQILDTRLASVPSTHSDTPPPAPTIEFSKVAEASHTYPITRILWEPAGSTKASTELLATSGDHLRLWSLPNSPSTSSSNSATPQGNSITRSSTFHTQPIQKLTPLALLSNSKSTDFTAPLTSLDWNPLSPSLIITSSIDTTCTIWDIPTLTAKTQLIAHDKEVFDVRFMSGSVDVFASCGADGSVRMFDLRSLEHSTIIYEPGVGKGSGADPNTSSKEDGGSPVGGAGASPPPLLRLAASPHDQHLIATFSQDSNLVRILDVRQPGQALIELKGHTGSVNCIEWNPTKRGIIAGGADDSLVLIWDLVNNTTSQSTGSNGTSVTQEKIPVASWKCDYEVNNISWSPTSAGTSGAGGGGGGGIGDWLGVLGGRGIWGVKV
ncbi:unnamed protein product, partial [Tuber aestivum]